MNSNYQHRNAETSSVGFEEISLSRKNTPAANGAMPQSMTADPQTFRAMDNTKRVVVVILFVINMLNYMDRFTVAGVLTDIQDYYKINNAEAGFLQTVFIVFFMMFAPICGFLGDRYNRKLIMVVGLCVWVLAVLLSSFMPENAFWAFVLLRGVVGIGEASYSTIAPTLISDLFVSKLRSRMLMVFYFAIPIGSGLGYVVGSSTASLLGGWQWGIRVTPVIGLISVIALVLFVQEPERGQAEKAVAHAANAVVPVNVGAYTAEEQTTSYLDDIKYLLKNYTYLWSIVGYTAVVFVTGTLAWWAPAAIDHAIAAQKGLNDTASLEKGVKSEVALTFGAITCLAGVVGVSLGTVVSEMWKTGRFCFARFPNARADPLISSIGSFIAVPLLFIAFRLMDKAILVAWFVIFLAITAVCLNWAINVDMLMYIIVPHRRSVANSWQIMISHLLGDAFGPSLVGLVSDWIRGEDTTPGANFQSLVYAFYLPNALLLVSGVAFLLCAYTLNRDVERFQREMGIASGSDYGATDGALSNAGGSTKKYNVKRESQRMAQANGHPTKTTAVPALTKVNGGRVGAGIENDAFTTS